MSLLTLNFIGKMRVMHGGHEVDLPKSRKTRGLLAFLSVSGRPHLRSSLAEMLWELPSDPRGALRWSMSKIRRLVDTADRQRLIADRESVFFNPAQTEIDVRNLFEAARGDAEILDADHAVRLLNSTVGEFLEGLDLTECKAFHAWTTAIREDVRQAKRAVFKAAIDNPQLDDEARRALLRQYAPILEDTPDARPIIPALTIVANAPAPDTTAHPGADPKGKPSIAVLPFQNLSDDREQSYFVDGIVDDIITELSRFRLLDVTARNASFGYGATQAGLRQIIRELGVQYVVEGSVRKQADRIRLNVQLIDAITGNNVWADRYERELRDVFAVQDEISESIAAAIEPAVMTAELHRTRRMDRTVLNAWDNFMRAYWHLSRFTPEDNAKVRNLSQTAIDLDPRGPRPYCLLAVAHTMAALYGWSRSREDSLAQARTAAERAIALDEMSSQTVRALGIVELYSRCFEDAVRRFEQAVALCPTEAENHALLGSAIALSGDFEDGLAHVDKAQQLSPRDTFRSTWFSHMASAAAMTGHHDDAVDWANESIRTNPRFPGGYRSLAAAAGLNGHSSQARSAAEKLRQLLPHVTITQIRNALPIKQEHHLEHYLDGLHNAGLPP